MPFSEAVFDRQRGLRHLELLQQLCGLLLLWPCFYPRIDYFVDLVLRFNVITIVVNAKQFISLEFCDDFGALR
jgi:hypothetical protein